MDEVSHRMFQFYVDLGSMNGIPAERLIAPLPRAPELMTRRRKWLDWDEYVTLIEQFETLCGGAGPAEEAFRDGTFRQVVRPFNAIVSYLTTARAVYWAGSRWFAPSLYRHLKFGFTQVDDQHLQLTVELPEPHRISETFFRHWGASMRFAPLQIGLPPSEVVVEVTGRRATYQIILPERRALLARIRSWFRAVVHSSDVVDEISRHQLELREAYEGLLAAHRTAEDKLRESEQTQRALLGALPDLIVVLGTDGTVHDVQGSARHPLFPRLSELRARSLSGLEAIDGFDRKWVPQLVAQAQEADRTGAPQFLELTLASPSQRLHFEWRTSALHEGRVLCVVRDTSESMRLQSHLLLSDRMASLGTLAAAVAHEINNPLAAMLNNLEVLRRGGKTGSDEPLRDALEAGSQIRDIVGQLRIFTRSDAVQLRAIDVNALMEMMLRMTAHRIRHSATVVREFGSLPPARADQARLGQVFVNLLVNAAQAMPDANTGRNRIHVKTWASGQEVAIEVRDTGNGIAEKDLSRIFDPFFTTKSLNDGTGLGLAICQRIVTDLGGTIEVESQRGEGSTFRVRLPAASPEEAVQTPVPEVGRAKQTARRRVLVVDDNPRLGLSLKLLLRDHDVTVVHHGARGVERMLEDTFELTLCDLMMPEVSGIELYRQVRAARPGLERRIVFMTGGAFTPEAREFLGSVPNRCLQKPFRSEELEAILAAGA